MRIDDIDIPLVLKQFYLESGIISLHPPQADVVNAGLLEGKNIVAAIPTASGKTLLSELAMVKSILDKNGKALYIVPLRALASEKFERFKSFKEIKKANEKGISVGIATGNLDSKGNWFNHFDIIVATSEKVDSFLRNGATWIEKITVVIADEVHLVDSPDRGPTLEIVLAKLMRHNPQIIALSATVGNANEVAKWLSAELVVSSWRPTELREGVFLDGVVTFGNGTQRSVDKYNGDEVISLVISTLKENGQCIVFENSRKNCEGEAKYTGIAIGKMIPHGIKKGLDLLSEQVLATSEVDTAKNLASCIKNGTAFHHAGLISEQRKLVEDGFKDGLIQMIAATSTLAAGLNLPARRVIIKGYKRHDKLLGQMPIRVLEYKQMAGRAGRPNLDPYGECVIIAKNQNEKQELLDYFIRSGAENIWSKIGNEDAFRTHVLSIIVTGYARSMDELMFFLKNTFFAVQKDPQVLRSTINRILFFLKDKRMIVERDGLFPTRFGELITRLYVKPDTAAIISEGLDVIFEKRIPYNDLTLIQLVTSTSNVRPLFMRPVDYLWIYDFIMQHHGEFVRIPENYEPEYELFLSQVKTTCIILDWIGDVKIGEITNKYGIGEGDVNTLSDTVLWLVHSMTQIAMFKRLPFVKIFELEEKLDSKNS